MTETLAQQAADQEAASTAVPATPLPNPPPVTSAASVEITERLQHVLRFTQTENTALVYALRGWFASLAGIPGAIQAGDDAWSMTVLLEHYDSTLDENPANRTPDQINIYNILAANAKASQNALDALMGASNTEDARLNNNVAAYVNNLIATYQYVIQTTPPQV